MVSTMAAWSIAVILPSWGLFSAYAEAAIRNTKSAAEAVASTFFMSVLRSEHGARTAPEFAWTCETSPYSWQRSGYLPEVRRSAPSSGGLGRDAPFDPRAMPFHRGPDCRRWALSDTPAPEARRLPLALYERSTDGSRRGEGRLQ